MGQIGRVIGIKMLKMKKEKQMKRLEQYPILHRFLARLYSELDVFAVDDMLAYIADDRVSSYCKCKEKGCASFFMTSDRELDLSAYDGVYVYDCDKGMIVLEFFENGDIDVQALEYEDYPFKEELKAVYEDEEDAVKYALESDLEEELQKQKLEEIEAIVNEYFSNTEMQLPRIVID